MTRGFILQDGKATETERERERDRERQGVGECMRPGVFYYNTKLWT